MIALLKPELTYLGDRREALKDRVWGPDFYGEYVRVAETTYDGTSTKARFETLSPTDMTASTFDADGQRILAREENA